MRFKVLDWFPVLLVNQILSLYMFQIKFTVQGEELVIPLGSVEDEDVLPSCQQTVQRVLVAKDSGLISDDAYHELRMSLPEEARPVMPPINVLKEERNRQNKIIDIHQITEVGGSLLDMS